MRPWPWGSGGPLLVSYVAHVATLGCGLRGRSAPRRPGMRPPVGKLHPVSLGNSCAVCRGRSIIPAPWLWRNSGLTPLARTTAFDLCRAVLGSRRRTTDEANPLPRAELHGCPGPQRPCYGSVYGYEFSEEVDERWRKTRRKGSRR
jgi:hypothetical protein